MSDERINLTGPGGRVAVVDALRTPFARIGTHLADYNAIELGEFVVNELLGRNELDPRELDQLVFGMTIMIPEAPFIAREIALACGLDRVDAYSETRACATSFQTAASGAEAILLGHADTVLTGGTDSTSDVRIPLSRRLSQTLRDVSFAKTNRERIRLLAKLKLKDILPARPDITEYSTGETMGESCEKMVKKWDVSRAEQDDIAHASHVNAARAWQEGRMDRQVMTLPLPDGSRLHEDNLVRQNSDRAGYDKLKPVYDRENGSVTAGNASPLTDGAAGLLLMSEEKARALGYNPLGYIRSWAFEAKTPAEDLLMGPVLAAPRALGRAGVGLNDLTLVDMHEAFAGQIACNLKGLASDAYIREMTGREKAPGEVDRTRLNVNGGSIAYGHPFGATGARVIGQTLHALDHWGGGLALTTACAAGGIGAAMVLETE
jgi:acetyl-CoA acyltransferase